MEPSPADESRHPPIPGTPGWEESWDFDFHTADADLGGYVHLGLRPHEGVSWFWAALVGDDRPLVTVVDHELRLPRSPGLDLRSEGLWTSVTCETPLEHWSVGLEAFGVALEDPSEAYRGVRGDRTALGLDLEWETAGTVVAHPGPEGYHVPCLVHGEVLVGHEVIAFDGWGGRTHVWGDRRWWDETWCTTSARCDDGTTWHADAPDGVALLGAGGLPGPGRLAVAGRDNVAIEPVHHAPVRLDGPGGRTSRLARSLCRYVDPGGRRSTGWAEWNEPQPSRSTWAPRQGNGGGRRSA